MTKPIPKMFISYSWTSPEHKEWVLNLATQLRENGVDVILDEWDLKEGDDKYAFMEQMVTDQGVTKVALICDKTYSEKADGRNGGVGTETQIISSDIYNKVKQNKFVPVLRERDDEGNPFLPAYCSPRFFIDFSDDEYFEESFEQLLRWAFDKPLHKKPELGKPPAFLDEEEHISLQTTAVLNRALKAIREDKPYCVGAVQDYFERFAENLEKFRISVSKDGAEAFDEKVVASIKQLLPYRDEFVNLVKTLSHYRATEESWQLIHRFFEDVLPYYYPPQNLNSYSEDDFDNFKFFVHELFLYAVAILIKQECFQGASCLLDDYYYVGERAPRDCQLIPSLGIYKHLKSMERRKIRLKMPRLSLHADLLKERNRQSSVSWDQIMQADLIMYVRGRLSCLANDDSFSCWYPVTLVYAANRMDPFEAFAKAASIRFFDKMKCVFGIDSKDKLLELREKYRDGTFRPLEWEWGTFCDPFYLMGLNELSTLQ